MNKKRLARIIAFFAPCLENKLRYWYASNFPKKYSERLYANFVGGKINWNNPEDFNEKIQWLKFYSDTSLWSDLADKYKVREYVEKCGLKHILNDLYAKFDKIEDIDISNLPNSFILKANDRSGGVLIVRDKTRISNNEVKDFFKNVMKHKYGIFSGELHYRKIKSCIIAEKLLSNDVPVSSSLIDYKFHCFKGQAKYIMVCINKNLSDSSDDILLYDLDWHAKYDYLTADMSSIQIPKPQSLSLMIQAAEILSAPFPSVRVDFYEVGGNPIFGEMTFTSEAGTSRTYTDEFLKELGGYIDIESISNH